jgi:3-oxoadipate enol-lactonase
LVLASTAAFAGGADVWNARIATVRDGGMDAVLQATIERWVTAPGRERLPNEVALIEAMIMSTPAQGFCGCCAAIRDMDQREDIKAITTPTHVIVGEHDSGTPVSAAQLIHDNIQGSGLTIIPDSAHFVQMEQADAFNNAMLGFLKDFV